MKGDDKMISRNYIECLKIYLGTKTNIVFDEQTINRKLKQKEILLYMLEEC